MAGRCGYFTLSGYIWKVDYIRNRCCNIINNNILGLRDSIAIAIIVGPGNNCCGSSALIGSVSSLFEVIEPAAAFRCSWSSWDRCGTLAGYIWQGGYIRNRCGGIINYNILGLGDSIAIAIIVGPGNVVFPGADRKCSIVGDGDRAAHASVAVGGGRCSNTRRLHLAGWLHQEQVRWHHL